MVFLPKTSLNVGPFASDINAWYDWWLRLIDDILIDLVADTVYDKRYLLLDILLVSHILLYILAGRGLSY